MFLDTAKGLAIILVVIGHTFQRYYPGGLSSFPFRFIYSFHMPMFMLLGGMVSSLKYQPFPKFDITANDIIREIRSAVYHLLIPFVSWTIIYCIIFHRDAPAEYLQKVAASPDSSLWFLMALFYCRIYFAVLHAVLVYLCTKLDIFRKPLEFALITLVSSYFAVKVLPIHYLGLGFFKSYVFYYVLGVIVFSFREKLHRFSCSISSASIFIILFLMLMPLYYFHQPNPVSETLSGLMSIRKASFILGKLRLIIALLGTISFMYVVKL